MAANASTSASFQATESASLAEKINQIKEQVASKAANFVSQVAKKLQNKAYFGIITSIEGGTVKIALHNNEQIITTNEYTTFSSALKSSKKISVLKDLTIGDFVSSLGDVDDKAVLKAKALIKSQNIASDSSRLTWGQVLRVNGGAITIKLPDNTSQTISASNKNPIFLGQEEASLLDLKIGRTIIARGKQTLSSGLISSYIYIVPQSATSKPEKVPDSPKPAIQSASPSATPKKK